MIFDNAKLKDTNTRLRYQMEARNRFASLEETDADDIEVRSSNFKDAVYTIADSVIGQRLDTHKKQWISNES